MKTSGRVASVRAVLAMSLLVGLSAGLPAAAAEGTPTADTNASCHQETRRVAVWPKGGNPKYAQVPSIESRSVTVCNGKVVSQSQKNASTEQKGG
jgi:hypothetical protein